MGALREWQAYVRTWREARGETDDRAWQRLAGWYDSWVRNNDYVDLVLPRLIPLVGPRARVLEIGPGSGAFTIPLARAAGELVALEPSAAMREVLSRNLEKAGLANVRIVPRRAEEGLGELEGPFDLALASHSLYNVEPIDEVIRELIRLARHTVILMGTGEQWGWYRDLHRRLKGEDRISPPHFRQFYAVLLEMGIYADVEIIWTSANYVFADEEDMVEWWDRHFGLGGEKRDELRSALLRVAERRGNRIGIYERRRMALVRIDRERNVFTGG
ncbi:class I SAM-dependent methyltransferase [Candidatus Bipolaricaulota sp. J31]